MKKALPVLFLLVGGGIGFAVVSAFLGKDRMASMAPANTTAWVEAQDLNGTWEAFKASEAWPQFEASKSHEELTKGWEQMVEVAGQGQIELLKELGLELNERTIMHFVGKNVALGAIVPAEADPSMVFMTQIDVAGLLADVEWDTLWEKLQTALGGADVKTEAYKDYDIATRDLGGAMLSFTLATDTLVVSPNIDTIKAVIDVIVGEQPSLADQAAFGQEAGSLPSDEAAFVYFDMAFFRSPERVKDMVHRLGAMTGSAKEAEQFTGAELQVLIDDMQDDLDGLAIAVTVPAGNIYEADLASSRGADGIFKENERQDLRQLVSDDTMVYVEADGFYDLVVGFPGSEGAKVLADTEAGQWIAAALKDPAKLKASLPPGSIDSDFEQALTNPPAFELQLIWAVYKPILREILGNDIAIAVETTEAEEMTDAIRPLAFVRSRPLLRVLTDLATGTMVAHADKIPALTVSDYAERKIYGIKEGPVGAYWTRIGQDLVLSSQADMVEQVIDRAAGNTDAKPQSELMTQAMEKLPEGYAAFVYMDQAKYQDVLAHSMPPEQAKQFEKLLGASAGLSVGSFAFYVDEDYTSFTVRTYQPFGEDVDPNLKELYANSDGEPAAWSRLPEGTIASASWEINPKASYAYLKGLGENMMGADELKGMIEEVETKLLKGKSIETDVIAHLGQSHGLGLVTQPRLAPEGAPEEALARMVAVPAGVAVLSIVDGEAFAPIFQELLSLGLEQANASRGSSQSPVIGHLYTISSAQAMFREGDQEGDDTYDYGTLEELAQTGLLEPSIASGQADGYVYQVHVSQENPEFLWIASASPAQPQEGDATYVINQDGMVFWTRSTVTLDDSCEPPSDAEMFGRDSPAPRSAAAADDGKKGLHLVEIEVAGTQAWTIALPEQEVEQMNMFVGLAFGPCYAFVDDQLLIATSQHALASMIEADDTMSDDDAFERLLDDHTKEVAAFTHLSIARLIEQVTANSELIAGEAAPAPASIEKPVEPQWPEAEGEAFEAAMEQYQKDQESYWTRMEDYQGKARAWRKEHAKENGEEMTRVLSSLDVLGHFYAYAVSDDDGNGGVVSVSGYRMDLGAR